MSKTENIKDDLLALLGNRLRLLLLV